MISIIRVGHANDIGGTGVKEISVAYDGSSVSQVEDWFGHNRNEWFTRIFNGQTQSQNSVNLNIRECWQAGRKVPSRFPNLANVNLPSANQANPSKWEWLTKYGWNKWMRLEKRRNNFRAWPHVQDYNYNREEIWKNDLSQLDYSGSNYCKTIHVTASGTPPNNFIEMNENGGDSYTIINIYGNLVVDQHTRQRGMYNKNLFNLRSDDNVCMVNIFGSIHIKKINAGNPGYVLDRFGRAWCAINVMDGGSLIIDDPNCSALGTDRDLLNIFGNGVFRGRSH